MADDLSHKRIAKNTIALYVRGLISVVIGLYTSRVVIDALGVDDYGVYGVAGGFVGMLSFLNSAMAGATSRFITYEIGIGDRERTKATFANSLTVHIGIALLIIVICEALGIWFLNTQLNIPEKSIVAANWVFQLSVITAAVSITQVPYTALILSNERMGIYAWMEIINVSLKLLIVYLLIVIPGTKLIIYAALTAVVSIGIAMAYRVYCLRNFPEARSTPKYDKHILKPILSFSGWDLFGNMCVTARSQGTTFLLNIFFGVAINGSASIASVVNGTISGFSNNIISAIRPQIIKNYARKNWNSFQHLTELGSQASFLLLSIMAVPLIVETPYIFGLWLGNVPDYVVIFSRVTILIALIAQLNSSVTIGIHASGKIKLISFLSGSIFLLTLPAIYGILKLGYEPQWAFIITVIFNFIILITNVCILKHNVPEFKIGSYTGRIFILPFITLPAAIACYEIHETLGSSFLRLILVSFTSVALTGLLSYFTIPNRQQRNEINKKLKRFFIHLEKKR